MCIRDRYRSARQGRYIPDLYDLYDLYDLAHVAGCDPSTLHDLAHVSWVGLDLYYADNLTTAGKELDSSRS